MKKMIKNLSKNTCDHLWKNYIEHLRSHNKIMDWTLATIWKDLGIIIVDADYFRTLEKTEGVVQNIYDDTDIFPSVGDLVDNSVVMKIFGSVPPRVNSSYYQTHDSFSSVNGKEVYETFKCLNSGIYQYKGRCWFGRSFVPVDAMTHLLIEDRHLGQLIAIAYYNPFNRTVSKMDCAEYLDASDHFDIKRCIEESCRKNTFKDMDTIKLTGTMGGYVYAG